MRGNKRLIQGMTAAGAAGGIACSVAFSQPQIMRTEGTIQMAQYRSAGIMAVSSTGKISIEKHEAGSTAAASQVPVAVPNLFTGERAADIESQDSVLPEETKTEENNIVQIQTENKADSQADDTKEAGSQTRKENQENQKEEKELKVKEKKKISAKEKKQAETSRKWKNKLMADVDDCLNIRETAGEDAAVAGKLRKGDVARVLKKGREWTKIQSGSVTGYVKNEYCVYGAKAYKLAKKICKVYATVQADGLRIRQKASENSTALEAAFKGDKLLVSENAKQKDGWVTVSFKNLKGYVSEDYVKVGLGTGKAISIEEERAMLEAQKKAEQMAAARSASSSGSSSQAGVKALSTSAVSSSDLTLLSAIIFCEAGGESYAGQVAVGAVVMNRVRSGAFPNSISGVVYQNGQFSPVANGALARALSNGNYRHCTSAAQAALAGSDNTGGAKFFHRVNGAAGLVIGNHVFY